jgi:hypothetical protein
MTRAKSLSPVFGGAPLVEDVLNLWSAVGDDPLDSDGAMTEVPLMVGEVSSDDLRFVTSNLCDRRF